MPIHQLALGPVASEFVYSVTEGLAREIGCFGPRGEAKALENSEPVLTPTGWKAISTLQVGDMVCAIDGTFVPVAGVYPQGQKEIYELQLSDGSKIRCTLDHLWAVETSWDRSPGAITKKFRRPNKTGQRRNTRQPRSTGWKVITTAEIKQRLDAGAWKRGGRWSIPLCQPVQFPEQNIPLDPWLLGVLLGDGGFTTPTIRFSSADQFIVDGVAAVLPPGPSVRHVAAYDYSITMGNIGGYANPVTHAIRKLGLAGKLSYEKSVPRSYLFNTPNVRLAVLQGLLDTDGTVLPTNSITFSSTSQALADDVKFLTESLGGVATLQVPRMAKINGRETRPVYSVTVNLPNNLLPFRLPRKLAKCAPKQQRGLPRRFIVGLKWCGPAPATCISIAHPTHLFLTDHFVPTHNTISALAAMIAHSIKHEATGKIIDDFGRTIRLSLPVPWLGVTDFHRSHRDKTVPSLLKDFWQGAWQLYDEEHLAVFKTDKERIHLHLFGVEDQGAVDRVRRETVGVWAEEVAPATTGHGVQQSTWLTALSSQRLPTHAHVAMFTSNYPDEDHWSWTRMSPVLNANWGYHPEDKSRMWFRIPRGDNPYISWKVRDEMEQALKDDRPDLYRRLVLGLPGNIALGPQVAVGFREDKHIAKDRLTPVKNEPLFLGQDGGLTPCTVIGQTIHGKILVYAALAMERGGMRQQYEQNVVPWLREYAPWALRDRTMIQGVYDPSLPDDESDSDRNPIHVVEELVGGLWYPGPVSWDARKAPMLSSFQRTVNLDPALQIDPVDGKMLIQALTSRWYYATDRLGGIVRDKPKTNHPYDDLGQAYCYFLCACLPEISRKPARGQGQQVTRFDARFFDDERVVGEQQDFFDPRRS